MRKRKHLPPTDYQAPLLAYFDQLDAKSEAEAKRPPVGGSSNALNRLVCRGYLVKATEGRFWITTDGLAALDEALVHNPARKLVGA